MNLQDISQSFAVAKATGVTVLDGRKAERKVIYVRANANGYGAGRRELVDATTNKVVGITNLENKDILPTGKNYLVRGLKITFAKTGSDVKLGEYGAGEGLPAFKNGELKIEQDGVLLNLPINAVTVAAKEFVQGINSEQFFDVTPFMLKDGKNFSISVEPVAGISADLLFEVALDVIEISESAKVATANQRICN